jgi:hypothetical protein
MTHRLLHAPLRLEGGAGPAPVGTHVGAQPHAHLGDALLLELLELAPARPFPSSIFLDKNRRDIGKSQSMWTDSINIS